MNLQRLSSYRYPMYGTYELSKNDASVVAHLIASQRARTLATKPPKAGNDNIDKTPFSLSKIWRKSAKIRRFVIVLYIPVLIGLFLWFFR